ncbi:hypothetical protein N2W52_001977 [Clostridium perfringens]|nr:hypothetical protein [Clostridium perfringens]MDK0982994.1 hypothetical protein [Clostridium perfringens]
MKEKEDITLILEDISFKRITKKVNELESKISKMSNSIRKMKLEANNEDIKYRDRLYLDRNIESLEKQIEKDRLVLYGLTIGREVVIQSLIEKVTECVKEGVKNEQ